MSDGPSELETRVVRLFVGHAESPVWFGDPRSYDEMGFDDSLTRDLRAWEADWYSSLDPADFEWSPAAEPEIEHRRRGAQLAARIAEALGRPFCVQVAPIEDTVTPDGVGPWFMRIESHQPPTQGQAAARFITWAEEARARHDQSATRKSGDEHWVAS